MIRNVVMGGVVILLVVALGVVCWCIDYKISLRPKCLVCIDVGRVKRVVPDFEDWQASSQPWESVPFDVAKKLCGALQVKTDENIVATYRRKIVRIEPDSFHAVKGRIIFEDSFDDCVYIYSYDPRYAPNFRGP